MEGYSVVIWKRKRKRPDKHQLFVFKRSLPGSAALMIRPTQKRRIHGKEEEKRKTIFSKEKCVTMLPCAPLEAETVRIKAQLTGDGGFNDKNGIKAEDKEK